NFSYFLSVLDDKPLSAEDSLNVMSMLQPFFSTSALLLDNLINWRKFQRPDETEPPERFYARVLVEDILSRVNHLLIDRSIKAENNINENLICYGNQMVFRFVIKNLILICQTYGSRNSRLLIESHQGIGGT